MADDFHAPVTTYSDIFADGQFRQQNGNNYHSMHVLWYQRVRSDGE